MYISQESWDVFFYYWAVLWCVQIIKYIMVWFIHGCICLFAHYTTSLSSLCRCICRYWISKILVRYILSSVCLRLIKFSQLSFMQYMGLCVFGLPISLMMIMRKSVLYLNIIIIIKSEVWPVCHCLRLHPWNNDMRCMSFYIPILFKISNATNYPHVIHAT